MIVVREWHPETDGATVRAMGVRFLASSVYAAYAGEDAVDRILGLVGTYGTVLLADEPTLSMGVARTVGMLALVVVPHPFTGDPYVEELALWVEPEARRRGVARTLLGAIVEWARQNGLRMVKMTAPVGTDLEPLYREFGFAPLETAHVRILPAPDDADDA
jgi:GNAT superfamily N-acetyltransferase